MQYTDSIFSVFLPRRDEAVIVRAQIQFLHQHLDNRELGIFQEVDSRRFHDVNPRQGFEEIRVPIQIFTRISHVCGLGGSACNDRLENYMNCHKGKSILRTKGKSTKL
jgi:hypothetical protein